MWLESSVVMVMLVMITLTASDRKNNGGYYLPKKVQRWAIWDL